MIPLVTVMLAVYIVARCLAEIARLVPHARAWREAAILFAIAAIVTAMICAVQIVPLAERLDRETADALQQLMR